MSTAAPRPISPAALSAGLSQRILELPGHTLVAVDGAPAAHPAALADELAELIRAVGRPTLHVEDRAYWRDASIRLQYGREDLDAYLGWVDAAALHREAITPFRAGRRVLPSLRDPNTNRSTRAEAVALGEGVLLISGSRLLRLNLDADLSIHLAMSPAALQRRTPTDWAWTLPAFARYERECDPQGRSDVVVRCDDPRHPAALGLR